MSLVQHCADAGVVHSAVGIEEGAGVKPLEAFMRQRRRQYVGRRVQVALRVTANQLLVFGESHVAFNDARAHARCGFVRFFGVLWELQRRAAMAD